MSNRVFIASDHAGYSLKRLLCERFAKELGEWLVEDLGTDNEASVDYPDFAAKVARKVVSSQSGRGVLVCGSGIGMSIAANKIAGIRAVVAWDTTSARLSREHNDANVLCLGSRLIGPEVAWDVLKTWLSTPFQQGRHSRRVEGISALERRE